ncbi:MAG: C_GCAxxG_C_C family protein [Campylobacterales bacterium]|nr:C_GCAxxG_C_C family protein [Campylobacterales bacterium]
MKEKKIKKTKQDAQEHFNCGFHCAESVLSAIAYNQGIESELFPNIATGFCGGMGHTCGPCGAFTGAVLGVNIALGRKDASKSVDENYAAVQKLTDQFCDMFDSVYCSDLLGCDLGTDEGQKIFIKNNLRTTKCADFTAAAAELAAKIIEEYKDSEDITSLSL